MLQHMALELPSGMTTPLEFTALAFSRSGEQLAALREIFHILSFGNKNAIEATLNKARYDTTRRTTHDTRRTTHDTRHTTHDTRHTTDRKSVV